MSALLLGMLWALCAALLVAVFWGLPLKTDLPDGTSESLM